MAFRLVKPYFVLGRGFMNGFHSRALIRFGSLKNDSSLVSSRRFCDIAKLSTQKTPLEALPSLDLKNDVKEANNEIQETYKEDEIIVNGEDVPRPFLHFNDFQWPKKIAEKITSSGFKSPSPIQCQAWPVALEGRDLVGIAGTGTGKTWAFMLPAMVHIDKYSELRKQEKEEYQDYNLSSMRRRESNVPKVLVLAPTRELVHQIHQVTSDLNYHNAFCFFGGASRNVQIDGFRRFNPEILISTPGRLIDFLDSREMNIDSVSYFVLDEADRLLDMGFEPQIRRIVDSLPRERQTLLWSATWPKEVEELAHDLMRNYIHINVGSPELHANSTIEQKFVFLSPQQKVTALIDILKDLTSELGSRAKVLIFSNAKSDVERLSYLLEGKGFACGSLHGGKTQLQRSNVTRAFREGRRPILIATDVASRGLDVKDIKIVINFDMPRTAEDYVHRIGRTGRQGLKGKAISLFTFEDQPIAAELKKVLETNEIDVPAELQEYAAISKSMLKKRYRNANERYQQLSSYNRRSDSFDNRNDNFSRHRDHLNSRRSW